MPPPQSPPSPVATAQGDIQNLTKLIVENQKETNRMLADNHQQTLEMFKQFNAQSQNTVKELFAMFADKLAPKAPPNNSPCDKEVLPCSSKSVQEDVAAVNATSKPGNKNAAVTVPVVVNTPPKEAVVDLTVDTAGEEKVSPPPTPSAAGVEKECSPELRKPKIASVVRKVVKEEKEQRPIIRDHRRNLKRKSESGDSDSHKKQKLERINTARALAELTIPKVVVRSLEDDHQVQRDQFTKALLKLPVWFPMELSFTAYLVVRFLFVHEKARFHAKLHSDKGQNFQQYRKPFHYYGIKAAEIFDQYAQRQYVNQAFQQGGPQLKSIIPWFRQWPKQRMHQLTPHCNYYKQQKTVSLRTNVDFFEKHLKKLGGKSDSQYCNGQCYRPSSLLLPTNFCRMPVTLEQLNRQYQKVKAPICPLKV